MENRYRSLLEILPKPLVYGGLSLILALVNAGCAPKEFVVQFIACLDQDGDGLCTDVDIPIERLAVAIQYSNSDGHHIFHSGVTDQDGITTLSSPTEQFNSSIPNAQKVLANGKEIDVCNPIVTWQTDNIITGHIPFPPNSCTANSFPNT